MPKTLEGKLAELSPGRRKRVEARTAELVAEEQSLRDLRHALALTQEHMAEERFVPAKFSCLNSRAMRGLTDVGLHSGGEAN